MNALKLCGMAALACLALPRAEAFTITFNPATTTSYLDVTISAPGQLWFSATGAPKWIPDETTTTDFFMGWRVGGHIAAGDFNGGSLGLRWLGGNGWGYQYDQFETSTALVGGQYVFSFSLSQVSRIFPVGWIGPVPTLEGGSTTGTPQVRILWDLTSVSVPDVHSTLWAFAATVGLIAIHRRRRIFSRPTE
jgi:hypothetical protein